MHAPPTTVGAEFSFEPLEPPASRPTIRQLGEEIAAARGEADRIREEARAEGYAAGRAEGLEQARADLAPAGRALAVALQKALTQSDRLASSLEREAVELALAVAEKVVAAAVDERPDRVLDVIGGSLRGIVERSRLTILVHPDDVALVRDGIGAITNELGGVEHCDVQAERRVARGGALLRTTEGEVDVRLQSKLDRAAELLREVPA
jgi:flagellar biosynthesis/type III secretory pathway protein FliH